MFNFIDGVISPSFKDSVVLDFDKNSNSYTNVVSFSDGQNDFATIQDAKQKQGQIKKLYVTLEATHEGKTLNYTRYNATSMENSAYTWTHPFNKPVCRHHDTRQDAIGRVVKATFGDSKLHPGTKTIFLELEITAQDAIEKFLDGRYLTVSIGGTAKELKCGICGTDLLNDRFCGHWLGRTYSYKAKEEDQAQKVTCYWDIGEMIYNEVSPVNRPADPKQGNPTQMKGVDEEGNPVDPPSNQSNSNEGEEGDTQDDLDDFNNVFNDGENETNPQTDPTSDPDTTDEGNDPDNVSDEDQGNNDEDKDKDKKIQDLEKTIKEQKELIDQLKTDNELKDSEKQALITDKETLVKDNKKLKDEKSQVMSTNVKMLQEFKNSMAHYVRDFKKRTNSLKDEETLDSISSMKLKDLKIDYDKAITDTQNHASNIKTAASPGVVDNKNTQGVDNEDGETKGNKEEKGLTSFISNIINQD